MNMKKKKKTKKQKNKKKKLNVLEMQNIRLKLSKLYNEHKYTLLQWLFEPRSL